MDENKGHIDDQPPAHPPPKPPSDEPSALELLSSPTSEAAPSPKGSGFVRKTSMPLESQSSWRRNPVKRRKKTLDENSISNKVKLDASDVAKAEAINTTGDNPKTFKSVVGRHSLVMKQTPGAATAATTTESLLADASNANEKPISSKKPPKEKHRRSKSDTKLLKASSSVFTNSYHIVLVNFCLIWPHTCDGCRLSILSVLKHFIETTVYS